VTGRARGVALTAALLAAMLLAGSRPAAGAPKKEGRPQKHKHAKPPPGPRVLARSWALIDARTGEVITAKNGEKKLPIASTTKLMTAWVALKEMPLGKIVRAQPYEAEYGESLMGLRAGQRISIRDLLYGLILRSGNDAAHTLAVDVAGSQKKFVAEMNRYAAALGLADTHYANPIGLDQKGNYSSARDLATLTQHLLRVRAFAKIADARSHELTSVRPKRRLHTIDQLLEMAPWITGVKTGHTWGARYVLVGSGRRRGVELIAVSIGAPTDEARFSDDLELLEYGFSTYHRKLPIKPGKQLAEPSIRYSGGALPLRAAKAVEVGVREGQKISIDVSAPSRVEGPIRRGAVLGHAVVYVDGLRAGAVGLIAARAVPKASRFDHLRGFLGEHWLPIAAAVCVILIGAVLLCRRLFRANRRRGRKRVNLK
jgi:D-alanyl-D-alanine carboxypeptidase (penicillin-binding protein 5/6)